MKFKPLEILTHIILILGVLLMVLPIWFSFATSTHDNVSIMTEGMKFFLGESVTYNYNEVVNEKGGWSEEVTAARMFVNSFIMALGIATLKVVISAMSAYALVYFRFKLAVPIFWLIFITLLVPLEVRIFPSYKIVSDLGLTNTYTGLILPLVASATATFFFRQFYKTIPDELLESAKLDGANSWRFFIDFLLTTDEKYWTVVMGMKIIFTENYEGVALPRTGERFAYIILSMLPPVLVVVILQRWFIKGLIQIQTEK